MTYIVLGGTLSLYTTTTTVYSATSSVKAEMPMADSYGVEGWIDGAITLQVIK